MYSVRSNRWLLKKKKKNEYTGNSGRGGSITNCYCTTRIAPISPSTYDEMSCLAVQIGRGTGDDDTGLKQCDF